MSGIALVAVAIGIPALVFALWPLLGRGPRVRGLLPLPPDPRQQLEEEKRAALAALRELAFEHESGHISDADYATLRARYETDAAQVLTALDRLGPAALPETPSGREEVAPSGSAWRRPLALGAAAVLLLVFGVVLGAGIGRYTEPDPSAGTAMSGAPAPAPGAGPGGSGMGGSTPGGGAAGASREVTPEVMQRMLSAARESLTAGNYGDALAAYQAVLKRDPKNLDAMTHLGLIDAIGGHTDPALSKFDRALSIDPNYLPALFYRGQVLYEAKKDTAGAIKAWEKFLAVAPPGEDRDRVAKLIQDARAKR